MYGSYGVGLGAGTSVGTVVGFLVITGLGVGVGVTTISSVLFGVSNGNVDSIDCPTSSGISISAHPKQTAPFTKANAVIPNCVNFFLIFKLFIILNFL